MKDNYFDFDDISGEELGDIDIQIAKILKEYDTKTAVLNPKRAKDFANAVKLCVSYAKKHNAKVTYEMHKPYKHTGCVTLLGKNMAFDHKLFMAVSELSSVVDIYTKIDNTVQIDFCFNDLTVVQE